MSRTESGRLTRAAVSLCAALALALSSLLASGVSAPAAAAAEAKKGAPHRATGPQPDHSRLFPARTQAPTRPVLPPGFHDDAVITGVSEATVVQFAADGRVYIGAKDGRIYEFDSIDDPSALLVKDLSTNVYDYGDRGLLGMALDPNFANGHPYVYILYTLDAPIGGVPPVYSDSCPDENQGCMAGARLSRFKVKANGTGGAEQVLIEDWCQQFNSHSIGTLAFGPDGALYVGGGDGASYVYADYGQTGNPCGDPNREGGALRAQDDRTQGDPTGMNGSILRVDPATGSALPDNPLVGNGDPTDDRLIAFGMRNPYRFVVKPGTDSIFVGDVGWNSWEEIDKIGSAGDGKVENFGWPCYEGDGIQPDYQSQDLQICNKLYAKPKLVTEPVLPIVHNGGCDGSFVLSGVEFYQGGTYPAKYDGALFVADVYDQCIWTMKAKPNGDPKPGSFSVFSTGPAPVDLKVGPGGDIFYVDWFQGALHRISYSA
jgi:glucose/arabinose dehydrogenase